MKNSLILKWGAVYVAATLSLTACGDDSGSNAGGNFQSETFGISIDESRSVITMYENDGNAACVLNEDGSYAWRTGLLVDPDTSELKYFFVGDTLVLQECGMYDGAEECYSGAVLVGGKAGSLKGTWRTTNCRYREGGIACKDDGIDGYSVNYQISGNTLVMSADVTPYLEHYNSVQLMESEFAREMIMCLSGSYCHVHGSDVFYDDVDGVEEAIEEYGVTVASKSKSAAQIVVNGLAANIKVNKASYGLDDRTVDVTVSINGQSCNMKSFRSRNVKQYCSANYEEGFDTDSYYEVDGSRIEYVYEYEIENEEEFLSCVNALVPDTDSSYPSVLYKQAAEKQSLRQDIHETQERLMRHVLRASGK